MSSTEDFWDDCKYEPRIEDSELTCKYKLTYNLLSKNKPSTNSKSQNALDHCHKMYSQAQKKFLIAKKHNHNQTRNPCSIEDITECTWKPKITETHYTNDKKLKRYNSQSIYQRGMIHVFNHLQEIKDMKLKTENIILSTPFKPSTNHKSSLALSKVFGSNYRLDQNDSLHLFFHRYEKARKREEEKKTFFETNILQIRKDSRKISKASRSLSTKESKYIKRSLHEELFSMGTTQEK